MNDDHLFEENETSILVGGANKPLKTHSFHKTRLNDKANRMLSNIKALYFVLLLFFVYSAVALAASMYWKEPCNEPVALWAVLLTFSGLFHVFAEARRPLREILLKSPPDYEIEAVETSPPLYVWALRAFHGLVWAYGGIILVMIEPRECSDSLVELIQLMLITFVAVLVTFPLLVTWPFILISNFITSPKLVSSPLKQQAVAG